MQTKDEKTSDRLGLAIGIWFCTVPLIFFLSVLFFDVKVALVTGVALFVIILLVCNIMCRISRSQSEQTR